MVDSTVVYWNTSEFVGNLYFFGVLGTITVWFIVLAIFNWRGRFKLAAGISAYTIALVLLAGFLSMHLDPSHVPVEPESPLSIKVANWASFIALCLLWASFPYDAIKQRLARNKTKGGDLTARD